MSAVTREYVGGALLAVVGAVAFVVYVLTAARSHGRKPPVGVTR